jgi:dolichol kinase
MVFYNLYYWFCLFLISDFLKNKNSIIKFKKYGMFSGSFLCVKQSERDHGKYGSLIFAMVCKIFLK